MAGTGQLQRIDAPIKPLTAVADVQAAWKELQGRNNIISPIAIVNAIPELHAISLRTVTLDPSTNAKGQGTDVYRDARFCAENERALGGVALQKVANAAGIQIIERKRLDDRKEPYYCEIEITVGVRDFDGTWRQVTKAREVDLRDGAPETEKPEWVNNKKTGQMIPLDASALADKRRHIQSNAETKAFYRCIRTILNLRQKYTVAELTKPFVVPKLVPALDPSDPDQKKALIDMAVGKEAVLYGQQIVEDANELKDVSPAPAVEAPTTETPAVEDQPVEDDADFEPLDFPDAQPEPPKAVCGCICGCQLELTEEVARITTERMGSPRCRECFPGQSFNIRRHAEIDDLKIPKYPGLTAARVIAGVKRGGQP